MEIPGGRQAGEGKGGEEKKEREGDDTAGPSLLTWYSDWYFMKKSNVSINELLMTGIND